MPSSLRMAGAAWRRSGTVREQPLDERGVERVALGRVEHRLDCDPVG